MTSERQARALSGWIPLPFTVALYVASGWLMIFSGTTGWIHWLELGLLALAILSSFGYFTLQPNEARLLILFGHYKGTTRQGGFLWGNPFFSNGPTAQGKPFGKLRAGSGGRQDAPRLRRYKLSLRARTLNGESSRSTIAPATRWRLRQSSSGT
jgi:hypothetical protein